MSQTASLAAVAPATPIRPDVQGAIANASAATGVDFQYLLGQARLESSLDPAARAGASSAAGLFQFTAGTWLSVLDRHGAENGFGWASNAIVNGRIADPALRQQVLALRYDPQAAALMAGELAADNRAALGAALGREPDASELYLAHFLGADGARRFLTAMAADPGQSAAGLLPTAAAANRSIFYDDRGAARTLADVMGLLRSRLDSAMAGGGPAASGWAASSVPGGGFGGAPWAGAASGSPPWGGEAAAIGAARPSMAETLAATFGPATGGGMPGHVRAAYGKLQALGL